MLSQISCTSKLASFNVSCHPYLKKDYDYVITKTYLITVLHKDQWKEILIFSPSIMNI